MRKKTSSSESARSASAGGTSSAASEGTLVSRRLPGTIAESVSAIDAKFFFCKQKTAYEFLRSDWSSDVCSSDLFAMVDAMTRAVSPYAYGPFYVNPLERIGRASCRERVCQYVEISVVAVSLKKKARPPGASRSRGPRPHRAALRPVGGVSPHRRGGGHGGLGRFFFQAEDGIRDSPE